MSELAKTQTDRTLLRKYLLVTVSTMALATIANVAQAADRPTAWIEFGGQMDQMQGLSSPFTAPFMSITLPPSSYKDDIFLANQRPPRVALGAEGKITLQPENSDWLFAVGVRFGRSQAHRHVHHQTTIPSISAVALLADTESKHNESHFILDFSVGRDVGLGLLGPSGNSNLNAGIRFAQFSIKSDIDSTGRPHVGETHPLPFLPSFAVPSYSGFAMQAHATRNFKGVGPSLTWNASAAILGDRQDGELTLDWGINAAVLFGRQKAETGHSTQGYHNYFKYDQLHGTLEKLYTPRHYKSARSRSVAVPNLGGFAGVSVKYPNAKFSLGYRADFFFGAVDAGIDHRRTKDLGFQGPFATVSVGLGG